MKPQAVAQPALLSAGARSVGAFGRACFAGDRFALVRAVLYDMSVS